MSDCNKLSDLITMYCDEEITQEEKALVENHIKTCEKCKKKLDTMIKAKEILKNSPALPVPESMFEDFLKNKEVAEKQEKKIVPFYKNFRVYASVAAVFIFAFVLKSGLIDNKFMPEQITDNSYTNQTLTAGKNLQSEKSEATNDAVLNNQPKTEKKAKAEKEDTSDTSSQPLLSDTSVAPQPAAENTPAVAAFDTTETEPASGGGGGASVFARVASEPIISAEVSSEEITATIFVPEQLLERASELLGDNTYLLYQAEQKLNENEIPFESNFLELDESKEYKITIIVKNE